MLLCAECIIDRRESTLNVGSPLKEAVTIVDGLALCADHMIAVVTAHVKARAEARR